MTLGRVFGWLLIVIAGLTASSEVVIALGTGAYDSIATIDIWTLMTGRTPDLAVSAHRGWSDALEAMLFACPAWMVIGVIGGALLLLCRPRRKRAEYREASMRFSSYHR